jgi:hypothetical protein
VTRLFLLSQVLPRYPDGVFSLPWPFMTLPGIALRRHRCMCVSILMTV